MLKLVIYLFLVCFFSSENALELERLCDERLSVEGNHKVNSYYRIRLAKKLSPLGDFLPNATLNFFNPTDYFTDPIYWKFKKQIKEIYSDEFMNSSQLSDKIRERQNFLKFLKNENGNLLYRVKKYFDKINSLLENINKLNENNLTLYFLPYGRLTNNLQLLANDLDNENQVSIFKDEFIYVFYEKQLATFDGFKMHRVDQPIFLDESTFAELFYSIYIPFFDRNHSKNIELNCSSIDNLPKFFSLDTVLVDKNRTESDGSN